MAGCDRPALHTHTAEADAIQRLETRVQSLEMELSIQISANTNLQAQVAGLRWEFDLEKDFREKLSNLQLAYRKDHDARIKALEKIQVDALLDKIKQFQQPKPPDYTVNTLEMKRLMDSQTFELQKLNGTLRDIQLEQSSENTRRNLDRIVNEPRP